MDILNLKIQIGMGIKGTINNINIVIGNEEYLYKEGISIEEIKEFQPRIKKFIDEGKSVIYISINKKISGIFALMDTIKPFAKEVIQMCKKLGTFYNYKN